MMSQYFFFSESNATHTKVESLQNEYHLVQNKFSLCFIEIFLIIFYFILHQSIRPKDNCLIELSATESSALDHARLYTRTEFFAPTKSTLEQILQSVYEQIKYFTSFIQYFAQHPSSYRCHLTRFDNDTAARSNSWCYLEGQQIQGEVPRGDQASNSNR